MKYLTPLYNGPLLHCINGCTPCSTNKETGMQYQLFIAGNYAIEDLTAYALKQKADVIVWSIL